MSKDRENAIKVLSHLSPSIREAIAVFVETTVPDAQMRTESIAKRDMLDELSKGIRSL